MANGVRRDAPFGEIGMHEGGTGSRSVELRLSRPVEVIASRGSGAVTPEHRQNYVDFNGDLSRPEPREHTNNIRRELAQSA